MATKKSKVLVLCSRGVNHKDRHLMLDLRQIIPHSRKDCKYQRKGSLTPLNEIAELATCDKCLYLENRKGKALTLWASNINGGPSAKFLVTNIHTMADIKLIGNCLKGSRPVLSFDQNFDKLPYLRLIKELFTQIFYVPFKHPKSQPYTDRVMTFTFADNHIWVRNFQVVDQKQFSMAEIGPRMVLMPMFILSESFKGKLLWANYIRKLDAQSIPKKKRKYELKKKFNQAE